MHKIRYKCKACGKRLSMATVWIDNGATLCKEHAEEVMLNRYGANHALIGTVKALELKKRRDAA